jgi:hypothetical protein
MRPSPVCNGCVASFAADLCAPSSRVPGARDLALTYSVASAATLQDIEWHDGDLSSAFAQAADSEKDVLVYF